MGLIVQQVADELLIYDLNSHKAHCLNKTAAAMWKHCDGAATVREIARRLETQFTAAVPEEVVWLGLEQLDKAKLLERDASQPAQQAPMTRREIIRRGGLAATLALPIVASLVAPGAAEAATCRPSGTGCNGNGQCCSHDCTGGVCA